VFFSSSQALPPLSEGRLEPALSEARRSRMGGVQLYELSNFTNF